MRITQQLNVRHSMLCLALGFSISSCGTLSKMEFEDPNTIAAQPLSDEGLQIEIGRIAKPLMSNGENHGFAVGVFTPDKKTHFFGYGKVGAPDKTGAPTIDTIFQLGSVSKIFVAALFGVLMDEGVVRPDDTVRSILPVGVHLSRDAGAITLTQLATHTSGLPRQPYTITQLFNLLRWMFTGKNLYSHIDQDFVYSYLASWIKGSEKEAHYEYSNIGYGLLAHLLQVKTGRTLSDLLDEKIFKPLNLKDTAFVLNDEQKTRLAVGHRGEAPRFMRRDAPIKPWDMGSMLEGTGALYTSTRDLLTFAKSNLGLSATRLEGILTSTHKPLFQKSEEIMGLGWTVQFIESKNITITFIHGLVAGYTAYLGIDDKNKVAVVVLGNSFNWDDKLGHNLIIRLAGSVAPPAEFRSQQGRTSPP